MSRGAHALASSDPSQGHGRSSWAFLLGPDGDNARQQGPALVAMLEKVICEQKLEWISTAE
jgi:hypothetical protein